MPVIRLHIFVVIPINHNLPVQLPVLTCPTCVLYICMVYLLLCVFINYSYVKQIKKLGKNVLSFYKMHYHVTVKYLLNKKSSFEWPLTSGDDCRL